MSAFDKFRVTAECAMTKARTGVLSLPHFNVETPVFMPVGTKGCMKGVLPEQLEEIKVQILLGNTYHLGLKPGPELLTKAGGLHKFMNWKRAILTDSGGFQMVSLVKLSEVTEEGVLFESPYSAAPEVDPSQPDDTPLRRHRKLEKQKKEISVKSDENGSVKDDTSAPKARDMMLLTPEKSMEIQNAIGADIMMQLDDVVSSVTTGPRVAEAMRRSLRWLDRCRKAHSRPKEQYLFPITQGGLQLDLRKECIEGMTQKESVGFAIGGLSGGEEKSSFWKIVSDSTDQLPNSKPRYVMGVGYAEDLVVCCALGADMFDCVFPTRTARFGCALVDSGQLNLKTKLYQRDFTPIDKDCPCMTCQKYTRSYLHHIAADISVAARLISVHNIAYQMNLMRRIRESIRDGTFPEFVKSFMLRRYGSNGVPVWIVDALASVNILIPAEAVAKVRDAEIEPVAPVIVKKRRLSEAEAE